MPQRDGLAGSGLVVLTQALRPLVPGRPSHQETDCGELDVRLARLRLALEVLGQAPIPGNQAKLHSGD